MPAELQALDARIVRLRERLQRGDPDMTPDEIQAAIERAEAKRRELAAAQPTAKSGARLFAALPRAADLYRRQITAGLNGDARADMKARVILRELFGGKIRMVPDAAVGLTAHWKLNAGAILRHTGTGSSGGSIPLIPTMVRLSLAA